MGFINKFHLRCDGQVIAPADVIETIWWSHSDTISKIGTTSLSLSLSLSCYLHGSTFWWKCEVTSIEIWLSETKRRSLWRDGWHEAIIWKQIFKISLFQMSPRHGLEILHFEFSRRRSWWWSWRWSSFHISILNDKRLNPPSENYTNFIWKGGSFTVQLGLCLTGFDSVALPALKLVTDNLFGWIQSSQTGGQPYSDTSPLSK